MAAKEKIPPALLTPAQHVRNDWGALLDKISYKAVVSNLPYLAFVSLLCVFYISNNHHAIDMQRELNNENKILKELRWKYMDMKMQLLNTKMESQVIRSAGAYGLKPLIMPAYKVDADTTKTN
jgi:hypothetical protein